MFSLSVLLLVASSVSALVIPRDTSAAPAASATAAAAVPPQGWIASILEDYTTYHTRYLALNCENQHSNKTFFDGCCHPLKVGQTVQQDRPAYCVPTAAELASATAALPTSTVVPPVDAGNDDSDDDDEDCDDSDDDNDATTTSSSSSSAKATPTPPPPKNDAPPPPQSEAPSQSPTDTSTAGTPKATSTTQAAPEKTPSSSSSSNAGGFATFFYQGGVAGACGNVHSDGDLIAAIDVARYGDTGVASSLCGKKVKITNVENSKTVTVTIADACPTCENSNSIDLSVGAFTEIATEAEGMVNIIWEFV